MTWLGIVALVAVEEDAELDDVWAELELWEDVLDSMEEVV